jgi:hypothetical protein
VFLETPITRAITLIGIFSARCNRRISAQSSTQSTPSTPWLGWSQSDRARGQIQTARRGQYSLAADIPDSARHPARVIARDFRIRQIRRKPVLSGLINEYERAA